MLLRSFAFAATLGALAATASAQTAAPSITNVWARATPAGATTAAAYMTVTSPVADRIVAVATPAAKQAGLHRMTMENGMMKMRQVAAIDLPAGKPVTLTPGGYHIMLTGLKAPLKQGGTVQLTLTFAKSGTRQVTAEVEPIGSMGPQGGKGGMTMPTHH
jgi:periplasmic copper chaperone A